MEVPITHSFKAMRDRWIGRCKSSGAITFCRDDESAGTIVGKLVLRTKAEAPCTYWTLIPNALATICNSIADAANAVYRGERRADV